METPVERHLLRARDLADRAYAEPLEVADLARAAGLSPAYFSRRFRAAFGVSPHGYLLTRRLERAAALLRHTDHSVARICTEVGLSSLGSFTTSFTRTYGALAHRLPRRLPGRGRPGAAARVRGAGARPAAEAQFSRRPGAPGRLDSRSC